MQLAKGVPESLEKQFQKLEGLSGRSESMAVAMPCGVCDDLIPQIETIENEVFVEFGHEVCRQETHLGAS